MIAYILINTEIGGIDEVLKAVKKIKEVKEADAVFGVYDIAVKVEVESAHKMKDLITQKVRRIGDVRSTLTLVVMDET